VSTLSKDRRFDALRFQVRQAINNQIFVRPAKAVFTIKMSFQEPELDRHWSSASFIATEEGLVRKGETFYFTLNWGVGSCQHTSSKGLRPRLDQRGPPSKAQYSRFALQSCGVQISFFQFERSTLCRVTGDVPFGIGFAALESILLASGQTVTPLADGLWLVKT
jgi:hypothetical protein